MPLKLLRSDPAEWEGTHIFFQFNGIPEGKKTGIWSVIAKSDNGKLGEVRWFARWRKYSFFPPINYLCVFEETCLQEIAEFIKARTTEHKTGI